ncbi:glycosyltransferase family 4 protein [Cupriavidus respiraculi]|uniref:GalNAc-alpha-(1->4)-GalNAc-alpha-(1->3)-diNAcBac-PP-undecaprenol alpha-1,4-N-acetyl-D-galactosaminyltransferase n=1 Tax=Cupriavidus respiraculi TaxID=195930 RepID=A0ABN7YWC7_9BURK|nr:glycosyltransferase family 4 protein [Cupriavidus respiraculi]CAG9177804.1 GalNAc-alpha-(1->4)-GalNAc-alpha-(1->3)-diNAcBac-PP-undecaprenol alpha-1,4-N-acetyl-D-galactosaminyltransferase [Cupriavidus respiraculi]
MNAPRTLCFLTGTLHALAGAERMTAVIASALAERGYRVHVLSLWDRRSSFALHPAVRHDALFDHRPSFKIKYAATVAGIRRYVRDHGIDTLIEVDPMLTLFTVPATLGLGVQRIAWEHCHFHQDLGRRVRRVARWVAARTDVAVVVLTERDRVSWQSALAPVCPVAAIPNALPFKYPEQAAPRNTGVVLAVGRLTAAKGFDVLLHAWALVAHRFPHWRLRIVGEGEERANLELLRQRLGVSQTTTLPGETLAIASEYRNASLFCLSSRYEGFGLVLIEAMAYGLPIVSTACEAGPLTLLRQAENAYMVRPDDPVSLAEGLTRLMDDGAVAGRLAAQGREDSKAWATGNISRQWIDLLNSLPPRPPRLP